MFALTQNTDSTLKILVCCHKPYTLPPLDDGILLPIHVGKALANVEMNLQADNQLDGKPCDNISSKNDSYCELTAVYWAWKNLRKLFPGVKYIGLFHYRRFLSFHRETYFADSVHKPESDIASYRVDASKVISTLESGKIILPNLRNFSYSIRIQYNDSHVSDDYSALKDVIRCKFPDYYDDFIDVMENGNKFSAYNMFVMKYEDFDRYCEWLFAVLAEVEPLIPYQHYSTYQKRVFGFMSERLINVYARKNRLTPAYSSIYVYSGGNVARKGLIRRFFSRFRGICGYYKNDLAFRISTASYAGAKRLIKKFLPGK